MHVFFEISVLKQSFFSRCLRCRFLLSLLSLLLPHWSASVLSANRFIIIDYRSHASLGHSHLMVCLARKAFADLHMLLLSMGQFFFISRGASCECFMNSDEMKLMAGKKRVREKNVLIKIMGLRETHTL